MAQTGIQTGVNPPALTAPRPVLQERSRGIGALVKKVLMPLASLRLTVVLLALAIVLVFFGTLAMIDQGLWTVVQTYFRSFFVWIPLQLLVQFGQVFFGIPKEVHVPGSFPFPGGWAIGAVMLVNLLAAHLVRFRLSWKRSGILILHAGLIILFLGELVTGLFAVESYMQIREGESVNYTMHDRQSELAIIDPSDPKEDRVVVVPEHLLRKGGTIRHDELPFDIEVKRYMVNSALTWSSKDRSGLTAIELPEVSGARSESDLPSVYLTLRDKKDGAVLAADYLASYNLIPQHDPDSGRWSAVAVMTQDGRLVEVPVPYQPVRVGGKEYEVSLRRKRTYKPYSIYLIDFRFDRYMGTNKPRNFSSEIRLIDPERNEDRTVVICMNAPMMHRGETFYQASFDAATEDTTVLQVVRDPGKPLRWLSLPYLGCLVVSLGMLTHFSINLVGFLQRRTAS